MLTIGKMTPGQEKYYAELAREDYYHSKEGGEPPGKWYGRGTEFFGLSGKVEKDDLSQLFKGEWNGRNFVQKGNGLFGRCPGWDLTFSVPKSVSAAWSQADEKTAQSIQKCQQRAVEKALDYIQSECGYTRRGHAGAITEKASNLVFATYEHGTSRAQQPQLHTHALLLNVAIRDDGTTGALKTQPLFRHKMAAGAIYRAELSKQLEAELGLESLRNGRTFEMAGVSEELRDHFSARRKEILKKMEELGLKGARNAATITYTSREHKKHIPRAELFKAWEEKGQEFGWTREDLEGILGKAAERSPEEVEIQAKLSAVQGVEELMETKAYFTEKDLVRFAAEAGQGRGIGAEDVLQAVREHLSKSPGIVALGSLREEAHFTTKEHYELEKKMVRTVGSMQKGPGLEVADGEISKAMGTAAAGGTALTKEQEGALRHILNGSGQVSTITGDAGTGKTTVLKPVREALEGAGYDVRGAALAGKAAQGMEEGAGIESQTIASLLWSFDQVEKGWDEKQAQTEFEDWVKEQQKTRGPSFDPKFTDKVAERAWERFQKFGKKNALNAKSVLVVDEAAMVDTRSLARVIDHVEKAGAHLVLVGDEKQLQAITQGGAFKEIAEEVKGARLTEVFRQRDAKTKAAVQNMAKGQVRESLKHYAESGSLRITENREEAKTKLIADWGKKGISRAADNLILASRNVDVRDLNLSAQDQRLREGAIGKEFIGVGGYNFHRGDRVVFTRNNKSLGVKNGNFGTVKGFNEKFQSVTIELDGVGEARDRTRTIRVQDYEHLKLGYAVTTHKSQGMTVKNSYILTDETMIDREMTYVQISRAKDQTRLYTTREEAGDKLRDLIRDMERTRQKEMALRQEQQAKKEADRSQEDSLLL
ncbi:MAG: MobF family relaxase [Verrucomicrobiota bacterium]